MKIAVIELHCHVECLYSFCKIFEKSDHQLTIFTIDSIYQELKNERFSDQFVWIVKNQKLSVKQFLKIYHHDFNNHDIVFIKTIQNYFDVYANLSLKSASILRIHNVNRWLDPWKNIKFCFSPYILYKDLSYIMIMFILGRDRYQFKKMLSNIDHIIFPNEKITDYVVNNRLLPPRKVGMPIPLATFDSSYIKKESKDNIVIVVPGMVDQRRRDYDLLLSVWQNILPKFERNVHLYFLGGSKGGYGKKILSRFSRLQNNKFTFHGFSERVPQQKFLTVIKKADVLLSPILLDTRFKIYKERYGYTKIAAIESDIIRYGKPAILPAQYPVENNLKDLVDHFTNQYDLQKIMLAYINENLLAKRSHQIEDKLKDYTPENLRRQIITYFSELIADKKNYVN